MTDLDSFARRFERRLDQELTRLTTLNSIDVHIDELSERDLAPQEQIDISLLLSAWILSNLSAKLGGKVVMLTLPLRNSVSLDPLPPTWGSLASQLSRQPPSIYVMGVTAFLQHDPAQRYIAPVEMPSLGDHHVAAYYQCWRLPNDPEDEGWSRDVRIVSSAFLRC